MEAITSAGMAMRWADFSGDFNPIHFDIDVARRVGVDSLIVHGMLALLQIKQEATIELERLQPCETWRQFKALFRTPVMQGSSVRIDLSRKRDAIGFALKSEKNECFRGSQSPVTIPDGGQSVAAPDIAIGAEWAEQQFGKFRHAFPFVTEPWIFLDALIFSEFLRDQFPKLTQRKKKHLVVQTSHRVVFDLEAMGKIFNQGRPFPALGYSIRSTDAISQEGSEFGVAELDVIADQRLVMRIAIGLLAKEAVD